LAGLLAIGAGAAAASMVAIAVYRWRMRDAVSAEVRDILKMYMPLSDDSDVTQALLGGKRGSDMPVGSVGLGGGTLPGM
jgi:hypothetical protein